MPFIHGQRGKERQTRPFSKKADPFALLIDVIQSSLYFGVRFSGPVHISKYIYISETFLPGEACRCGCRSPERARERRPPGNVEYEEARRQSNV